MPSKYATTSKVHCVEYVCCDVTCVSLRARPFISDCLITVSLLCVSGTSVNFFFVTINLKKNSLHVGISLFSNTIMKKEYLFRIKFKGTIIMLK